MCQGLTGSDYYKISYLQVSGARVALPIFKQAASDVEIENADNTILLVNYGSADGVNSKFFVTEALCIFTERFSQKILSVIYNDQTDNNFSTIFKAYEDQSKPLVFSSGKSFYFQVMPENSVHLAWSSYASIFLSARPSGFGEGLAAYCVPGSDFQKNSTVQAQKDWKNFLLLRAKELKPKGYFLCVTPGRQNGWETGFNHILEKAWQVLKEMATDWKIDLNSPDFPRVAVYPRSDEEILAPFKEKALLDLFKVRYFQSSSLLEENCLSEESRKFSAARRHTDFFMMTFVGNLEMCFAFFQKEQTVENLQKFKHVFEQKLYEQLENDPQPVSQHVQVLLLQKK
ncbi:hypothetical protein FAI41_02130 [Acetobacteraceae bacterium]|nr:hypothetical protein FAI41_02130 [Acetobacteraceae bacterium]